MKNISRVIESFCVEGASRISLDFENSDLFRSTLHGLVFNPLTQPKFKWTLLGDIASAQDCLIISKALIPDFPEEIHNRFFRRMAQRLLQSVLYALKNQSGRGLSFLTLYNIFSLGKVRFDEWLAKHADAWMLCKTYRSLSKAGSMNAQTIFLEATSALALWQQKDIAENTGEGHLPLSQLEAEPTHLMIQIPAAEYETLRPLSRLFCAAILRALEHREATSPAQISHRPIDVLINDQLCEIEDTEELEAILRDLSSQQVGILICRRVFGENFVLSMYRNGVRKSELIGP